MLGSRQKRKVDKEIGIKLWLEHDQHTMGLEYAIPKSTDWLRISTTDSKMSKTFKALVFVDYNITE